MKKENKMNNWLDFNAPAFEDMSQLASDLPAHCRDGRFVSIFPHINADGDALGAAMALGLVLKKMGACVQIVAEEAVPQKMQVLPASGRELVKVWPEAEVAEVGIVVDCGGGARIGERADFFAKHKFKYMIDHHIAEKDAQAERGCQVLRDSMAAATCELLTYLIYMMEKNIGGDLFDFDVAVALIVGIITDTGRLCYSNTREQTLFAVAFLRRFSVPVAELAVALFDACTPARLRLLGFLGENTKFYMAGKLAVCLFPAEFIQKVGAEDSDFEGLTNQIRNVNGVETAVVLRGEGGGKWRGSARSSENFDAQKLAAGLGGGGHKRAAGFTVTGLTAEEIISRVVAKAMQQLE